MRLTWRSGARWAALAWLMTILGAALLPLVWPTAWPPPYPDPEQINLPPSPRHWLGTDPFGRDALADILAGTRSLASISLPAAVLATLLGASLGAGAGYWGNKGLRIPRGAVLVLATAALGGLMTEPAWLPAWVLGAAASIWAAHFLPARFAPWALPLDRCVLTAAAALGAVPRLLLVLLLTAAVPASPSWLLLLLALTCWPSTARLTRTQVQLLRQQSYVEAGRAAGYSAPRLLWHHIGPNAWPVLRSVLPLNLSTCLALQTTLAFLGLGLPPDQADWGRTLANARLEPTAWWLLVAGILPLTTTTVALAYLASRSASPNRAKKPEAGC